MQETLQLCDIVTKITRKPVVKRFIESFTTKAAIVFHLKCFLSDYLKCGSDEDQALWSSHLPAGQRRAEFSRQSPRLTLFFLIIFFFPQHQINGKTNLSKKMNIRQKTHSKYNTQTADTGGGFAHFYIVKDCYKT